MLLTFTKWNNNNTGWNKTITMPTHQLICVLKYSTISSFITLFQLASLHSAPCNHIYNKSKSWRRIKTAWFGYDLHTWADWKVLLQQGV